MEPKVALEELALTAMGPNDLDARSLLLAFVHDWPEIERVPEPATIDPTLRAVCASIVELLAEHRHQETPAWTAAVQPAPDPVFLGMHQMASDPRWVAYAKAEAPEVLKRRNVYSMREYMAFA